MEWIDSVDWALVAKVCGFFAVVGIITCIYLIWELLKSCLEIISWEWDFRCKFCKEIFPHRVYFSKIKKILKVKYEKARCPHCKNKNMYKFKEE